MAGISDGVRNLSEDHGTAQGKVISRGYSSEKNRALFESIIDSDIIDHIVKSVEKVKR